MGKIAERFKETILWTHVLGVLIEWFGWKQLLFGFLLSAVGTAAGIMQSLPISIVAMAAFCVFVAALYLTQFPAYARATKELKPKQRADPDIWRHLPRLTLAQAACLLADVTPKGETMIPSGDADGYYHALRNAVIAGEIAHVRTIYDDEHTFMDGYHPHSGTLISREDLLRFAAKRKIHRAFLSDG